MPFRRKALLAKADQALAESLEARDPETRAAAYKRAHHYFTRVGDRRSSDAVALLLANAYILSGLYSDAEGLLLELRGRQYLIGSVRVAAQCNNLLGWMYVKTARYDEAIETLRDAMGQLEALDELDELVFCAGQLATAYSDTGRHVDATKILRKALSIAEAGDHQGAAAVLTEALGDALLHGGELRSAASTLLRSAEMFIALNDREAAAGAMQTLSLSQLISSQLAESERILKTAHDLYLELDSLDQAIECSWFLALAYTTSGRYDLADLTLKQATTECDSLHANLQSDGGSAADIHDTAFRLKALTAMTCIQAGDLPGAELATNAMRRINADTGVGDLGDIYFLEGTLAMAAGRHGDAEPLFTSAIELLNGTAHSGNAASLAGYHMALGVICERRGDVDAASTQFADARSQYADAGMFANVALIDLRIGIVAAVRDAEGPSDISAPAAASACDKVIPAFLYIDELRLQFPGARHRQAWRDRAAYLAPIVMAIAAAANDAQLIAELIETMINCGIHSAEQPSDSNKDDVTKLLEQFAAATGFGARSADESVPGATTHSSVESALAAILRDADGGRRLLGDLPMRAPPRLVMPNGVIALERFHALRDSRYPPLDLADRHRIATTI